MTYTQKTDPDNTEFDVVELSTAAGAKSVVSLHGGHVLSWCPLPSRREQLYLSRKANFDGSVAIRGGVPVLFPRFGAQNDMPNHGFARGFSWHFQGKEEHDWGESVSLRISDTPLTLSYWPYPFILTLRVELRDTSLKLNYTVCNEGRNSFGFGGGLHTYFATNDISQTQLIGLAGRKYLDGKNMGCQVESKLEFSKAIDRIYFSEGGTSDLTLTSPGRNVSIVSEGFDEVVVWNPWIDGEANIEDMESGDFRKMICVESVIASRQVVVEPGGCWSGSQTMQLAES